MARFYILSQEHIETGKRPKTPRQKIFFWKSTAIILSLIVLTETIYLIHLIK